MSKVLSDISDYVTEKVGFQLLNESTYIGMDNMIPNRGGITISEYVPSEGQFTKFNKGDVLIGNIRPYFKKIWLAEYDGGCSPDVLCIRAKDGISPQFLYALLSQDAFFEYDVKGAKGSKMPRGDKDHIMAYPVPEIENADWIGGFIDSLYQKIRNNNVICADLEGMAKLLYDYWFVQFDFPDENGNPYKSSGGKMVWSDELKREIPEGWEVKDILKVCDIVDCLHSKKPEYQFEKEECFLLSLENLTKDGHIDLTKKFYISHNDYNTWSSKIEVQEGDFVVTNAGRAGDIGRIPRGVKCAIGRNLTAIHPSGIDSIYLNMFLHSFYVKTQIASNLDQGSFFTSFNVYAIKNLKILVPDDYMMKKAIETFTNIIIEIEELYMENQQLASLRNFLLPMLMNGQVKVENGSPESEKVVRYDFSGARQGMMVAEETKYGQGDE